MTRSRNGSDTDTGLRTENRLVRDVVRAPGVAGPTGVFGPNRKLGVIGKNVVPRTIVLKASSIIAAAVAGVPTGIARGAKGPAVIPGVNVASPKGWPVMMAPDQ